MCRVTHYIAHYIAGSATASPGSRLCKWLAFVAFCAAAFGQNAPTFEIASIRPSAKSPNPFVRSAAPRNGRYEIHTASMVDLIQIAWGFAPTRFWVARTGSR